MSVADLLVPNPYPLNIGSATFTNLSLTGLTTDSSANYMLVQQDPSAVVERLELSQGSHTPLWFSTSGVTTAPASIQTNFVRIGNRVTCSFVALGVDLSGAALLAQISVPFTSVGISNNPLTCGGAAAIQGSSLACTIYGNSGFNNRINIACPGSTAQVGTAITGSFTYVIS